MGDGRAVPVSVVVPAHNAERWLARAVSSALADVVDEVVVVDDASDDRTFELGKEFADADPRVTLVRLPRNAGARVARHQGALRARNDWVAPLDSDDYLECGAVSDAYSRVVGEGAELCIWTMHRVDDSGGDIIWPNLDELDFPMTGRQAARLTLRGWRIHPLGVVSRARFLRASDSVSVTSHNSDELVTRQLLVSLCRVTRSTASYFYVKNPDSVTLTSPPDVRHLARSQAWLLNFAVQHGYMEEEPLLAHEMTRDGLWIAEQVAALHPDEPLGALLKGIRVSRPRTWRLGVVQGGKAAARTLLG